MNSKSTMALTRHLVTVALVMLMAGCAATDAARHGPYNVSADGNDNRLMLNGYDPVAYHAIGRHLRGKPDIRTDHDGVTYRFDNEANKLAFLQAPSRYVPQFGGFCANGIVYAIPWGGDADTWQIIDGKLFIFGGQASKQYFLMDGKANLLLANQFWIDEVAGGNATIQRYKRLLLRVPHYKTGAALEQAWQRVKPAAAP